MILSLQTENLSCSILVGMDKLLILLYVLATAGGLVLIKVSSNGAGFLSVLDGKIMWNIGLLTLLGIFVYGISFFLYIILISKFSLGYIVPITTGLVYILVFTASYFVFKEEFTSLKVLAIALIVAGVLLLQQSGGQTTDSQASVRASNDHTAAKMSE